MIGHACQEVSKDFEEIILHGTLPCSGWHWTPQKRKIISNRMTHDKSMKYYIYELIFITNWCLIQVALWWIWSFHHQNVLKFSTTNCNIFTGMSIRPPIQHSVHLSVHPSVWLSIWAANGPVCNLTITTWCRPHGEICHCSLNLFNKIQKKLQIASVMAYVIEP